MRVTPVADVFRAEMSSLFTDMEDVAVYIDDVVVISYGDFESHMKLVSVFLGCLEDAGMKINSQKSF